MKGLAPLILLGLSLLPAAQLVAAEERNVPLSDPLLDVNVRLLSGKKVINLYDTYKGKVVMVVNTASKCAFTPQYEGLEKLYAKYKRRGFVILGFPSNDFANQEPGSEKQIRTFCRLTYGVRFPMFAKTRVRKDFADPLYRRLGKKAGEYPAWNFHKYLIDRKGKLVASYSSTVSPNNQKLVSVIEGLLSE